MRPSDTVMLATHSEVPAFECSNGSTAPWYWVLNKDYTLQDLDGESAGTWSQLGTGISVTNQNNDLTQWEILGSDLTTSWGSCQHIAGPELTTQFFNLDYDGTRIFDIPWDGESLIGKTVQCDYYHFIDGEWRPGDGQTLSGLPSLWDFYSDATGQFNTFRQSTDGVFNWTVNDAGEYVIDILDQEFPYIHMLSQSGRRMVRRGDIWQLLPDHNGSLSGNDWQGGGFGCQVINR